MITRGHSTQEAAANVHPVWTAGISFTALILTVVAALAWATVAPPRALAANNPSQRQSEEERTHQDSPRNARYGEAAGSDSGRGRGPCGAIAALPTARNAAIASSRTRGCRPMLMEHAHRNGTGTPLRC